MKESDWKIFKQIKDKAIELFCSRALEEFEEAIKDPETSAHERYLLLYRLVDNSDKPMA